MDKSESVSDVGKKEDSTNEVSTSASASGGGVNDKAQQHSSEGSNYTEDEDRKNSTDACSPCSICDATSSGFSASRSGDDDDEDEDDDDEGEGVERANGEEAATTQKRNGVGGIVKSASKELIARAKMALTNPSTLWQSNKQPESGIAMSTLPRSASSSSQRLLGSSSAVNSTTESPRHLVTYVTSSLETIPVEINQDIPDVAL